MSAGYVDPASGRTRIKIADDGEPYTLSIPAIDCRSFGSFTAIPASLQVKGLFDETGVKHGPWSRGEITIAGTIVSPGLTFDNLSIEVNILAARGGVVSIIGGFAFSVLRPQCFIALDDPFEYVNFEARLVVNGAPLALPPSSLQSANVSIAGRFWR